MSSSLRVRWYPVGALLMACFGLGVGPLRALHKLRDLRAKQDVGEQKEATRQRCLAMG